MTNTADNIRIATSWELLKRASSSTPETFCEAVVDYLSLSCAATLSCALLGVPLCFVSLSFQPPIRLVQVTQCSPKPTLGGRVYSHGHCRDRCPRLPPRHGIQRFGNM